MALVALGSGRLTDQEHLEISRNFKGPLEILEAFPAPEISPTAPRIFGGALRCPSIIGSEMPASPRSISLAPEAGVGREVLRRLQHP